MLEDKVIIFPTDTVYGIGCSINDLRGQKRIYEIKKRPANKRLAVLCNSLAQIKMIAEVTDDAIKLIEAYMPGALTIILSTKAAYLSEWVHKTIAVRIPNHPLALQLLEEYGPMATTSVNLTGEKPINSYEEIVERYQFLVDKIYPNTEPIAEIASTIIDLTQKPYQVIREGKLSSQEILNFLHK